MKKIYLIALITCTHNFMHCLLLNRNKTTIPTDETTSEEHSFKKKYEELRDQMKQKENETLQKENEILQKKNNHLQNEIEHLNHHNDKLKIFLPLATAFFIGSYGCYVTLCLLGELTISIMKKF